MLQVPIAFDGRKDRDVVGVGVADVPATAKGRNHNERNTRTIAEEVQRLDVAGVIVAAAFVERNNQRGGRKQFGFGLEEVDDFLHHALEQIELRRSRVAVEQAVRFHERNRRKGACLNGGIEIRSILDMRGTLPRVSHDGVGVGLKVANVAVGAPDLDERTWVTGVVLESNRSVIGSAVVGPGNALFVKSFADGAGIDRWDGAAFGDSLGVHSAVGQKAGRVIVGHVEVPEFALWIGMVRKGSKVITNWGNAGLRWIAALGEIAVEIDVPGVLVV